MSGYESDSSLSDAEDYTETNVLLGYPSKEPTGDVINHIGGHPSWLEPESKPSASYAECKVCHSKMSLLLQLNGDLPEHFPNDERRLYFFTCRRKACMRKPGSIRAMREVRKTKEDEQPKEQKQKAAEQAPSSNQQQDLGAALFGAKPKSPAGPGNANPFSMSSSSNGAAPNNPFAPLPPMSSLAAIPPQKPVEDEPSSQATLPETFASKLRVSSPSDLSTPPKTTTPTDTRPWPSESDFPPPYPHLYLDADYEALTPLSQTSEALDLSSSSKVQYEDESSSSTTTANVKDSFESSLDKAFLKFSDRLSQNPEQILRYEWKGTPLLYSGNDSVASRFPSLQHHLSSSQKVTTSTSSSASGNKIPRCETCSAPRVFELQLVPGLISALEDDAPIEEVEEGMEWGTIILGVCERDCAPSTIGEVGYREEWLGVQWEERVERI